MDFMKNNQCDSSDNGFDIKKKKKYIVNYTHIHNALKFL